MYLLSIVCIGWNNAVLDSPVDRYNIVTPLSPAIYLLQSAGNKQIPDIGYQNLKYRQPYTYTYSRQGIYYIIHRYIVRSLRCISYRPTLRAGREKRNTPTAVVRYTFGVDALCGEGVLNDRRRCVQAGRRRSRSINKLSIVVYALCVARSLSLSLFSRCFILSLLYK